MRRLLREALRPAAKAAADGATLERGRVVVVEGSSGTGRSLVISLAAEYLIECGYKPIIVSPPRRHLDTSSLALIDVAAQLLRHGLLDHADIAWQLGAPWTERFRDVRRWLGRAGADDSVVILIDDASQWAIPGDDERRARVNAVSDLLLRDVDCSRILVRAASGVEHDQRIELVVPHATTLLAADSGWADLAEIVADVRDAVPTATSLGPAHVAALVAFAALGSIDATRRFFHDGGTPDQLMDRLVDHVSSDRRQRQLWRAWLTAAIPRRPIPRTWLDGELSKLGGTQLAVFQECLAIGDQRISLTHDARSAVWRIPEDGFMDLIRERACVAMRDRYLDEVDYGRSAGRHDVFVESAEAVFVAARLTDIEMRHKVVLPFTEQLNGMGLAALERCRWGAATKAFEYAIEIDPADAVSNHYFAFSLDNDARDPKQVDRSYRQALDLEWSHATWHARLISFLVVQARTADAYASWTSSLRQLLPDGGDGPVELYSSLHLPVAANALNRAELALGHVILDDVPTWVRSQVAGYGPQRRMLAALENAQEHGSFVPAARAASDWWVEGPELLGDRHPDGRPLQLWIAASIDAATDDGLTLTAAIVRKSGNPQPGTLQLTWEQLRDFAVDSTRAESIVIGDFLEIGYYGHGMEVARDPVIRVLPPVRWESGVEPPLDSARYIKRAAL